MRLTTILKWVFVVSLLGVLFLWLAAWFIWAVQNFMGSSAIIAACSMCALSCAECLERRRRIAQMWSGVAACAIAAAVWIYLVWLNAVMRQDTIEAVAGWGGLVSTWGVLCAIVAVMARHRSKNRPAAALAVTTEVAAVLLAITVTMAIAAPNEFGPENRPAAKLMGTLAVVMGFGLISWLIVNRLKQLGAGDDDEDEARLSFTLTCPRCGLEQPFTTGGANCNGCGLRVRVSVP